MDPNTLGAVISFGAGTITVIGAIIVILSTTNVRWRLPSSERKKYVPDDLWVNEDAVRWAAWWAQRGMMLFYAIMGVILVSGPKYLFGPTWFYFSNIPHGGTGMGWACLALMVAMFIGMRRRSKMIVSITLFAGGISFWIAAFLIAAEGISAHTGCMEAPFMMYAAVDMLIRAAVIRR